MAEVVSFFDIWLDQRSEVKSRETVTDSKVNKYYIYVITYNNMKICMRGFMQYTRCIVEIVSPQMYILTLHSNQSSAKGLFSWIRFMGKDKKYQYAGGVLQQNKFNQIPSINKHIGNSSYTNNTQSEDTHISTV